VFAEGRFPLVEARGVKAASPGRRRRLGAANPRIVNPNKRERLTVTTKNDTTSN